MLFHDAKLLRARLVMINEPFGRTSTFDTAVQAVSTLTPASSRPLFMFLPKCAHCEGAAAPTAIGTKTRDTKTRFENPSTMFDNGAAALHAASCGRHVACPRAAVIILASARAPVPALRGRCRAAVSSVGGSTRRTPLSVDRQENHMNGWMHEVWVVAQREFSDLNDVASITQLVIRLCVALVLGSVLGFERELAGRDAGLRTHMLVSTGSALFVLVPLQAGFAQDDMSRVLQGLVSGIGFLGAGAIIKLSAEREVRGLTTAASLWFAAGIGVAAGLGREATAILSTVIALLILAGLRALKQSIESLNK
jgi:putative Mg2+ transporter-C (MgtC) family protein